MDLLMSKGMGMGMMGLVWLGLFGLRMRRAETLAMAALG